MIDDIVINLWSSWNFVNKEDIRRKCNWVVDLSKFISNKKILNGVVALAYKQVCCQKKVCCQILSKNLIMLGLKKNLGLLQKFF